MQSQTDAAGAVTPVAWIFLLGLIGGIAVNTFFPLPIWSGIWIRLIGLLPLIAGMALFSSARGAFRHHKTSLMPWSPTTTLVQDGPYAFSRNPIYLAFIILYLGVSFIFDSAYILIMLVVVLVLFDRLQIPREEAYLEGKFGEEYRRYKTKTRRWL
jgi:protein-S-isoprenylcysteine O-methyltransferase Ste14